MDSAPTEPPASDGRTEYSAERRLVALRRVNRPGFRWSLIRDWLQSFAIAILLFFVLRAFFVEGYRIPSGSMERTLLVGDFLLVNKLAYGSEMPFSARRLPGLEAPHRRDIIVFRYPVDRRTNFIKRVVGLPGDTVAMRDGVLFVNGRRQVEPYAVRTDTTDPAEEDFEWQRSYLVPHITSEDAVHPSRNNWGPLVVPAQSYFVLGDNRDNSSDSRYWGFVPAALIEGRPIFVYYSYAPDTAGHSPLLTRVRWHRIGERVE